MKSDVASMLESANLFVADEHGAVRLPLLFGGRIALPPELPTAQVREALATRDFATLAGAQLLKAGRLTLVLPRVEDPKALVPDIRLLEQSAATPLDEALNVVERTASLMNPGTVLFERISSLLAGANTTALTGHVGALKGVTAAMLRSALDRDLGGISVGPGSKLLDEWLAGSRLRDASVTPEEGMPLLRAMPTRQLHITSGNSAALPLISLMHAFSTKSPVVIKLAHEVVIVGAALSLALAAAGGDHCLVRGSSVAYWPGGEDSVEAALLDHRSFERLVVWGGADTVGSLRSRSDGIKMLVFGPRYGASLIAQSDGCDLAEAARRGAIDACAGDQKLCTSSLVHYVEGSPERAREYSQLLAKELARIDGGAGSRPPSEIGRLRRALREEFLDGTWFLNGSRAIPTSAVVYLPGSFDIARHPMSRLVVVRDVPSLHAARAWFGPDVGALGIWPPQAVREVSTALAARGVSVIARLGEAATAAVGLPQSGARVASELVAWTVMR